MIPRYLMIQKMHLFNTRWALIVPGLVSAFSIYLARQFIGDIPDSLCEAAKIDGAGEVTVMLTVQDSPRKVLAEDRDQEERGERSETVVLSRGSSLQETVTVQEVLPRYQGALLVCPGGDDPEVRLKLTEARRHTSTHSSRDTPTAR